jgi:hypothetical protein
MTPQIHLLVHIHRRIEKDATVSSDYALSNGLISELLTGKDVEGGGRGLCEVM